MSVSVVHNQLLDALQAAGAQGVPEHEVVELGGRWWRNRLLELNALEGVAVGEWDGFYYLVSGPDVLVEMVEAEAGAALSGRALPGSERLRLFTPPAGSHYDE